MGKISVDEWARDARRQGMREDLILEMIETIGARFAEPYRDGEEVGLSITNLGRLEVARAASKDRPGEHTGGTGEADCQPPRSVAFEN